jgi:hypothetical protein
MSAMAARCSLPAAHAFSPGVIRAEKTAVELRGFTGQEVEP